MTRKRRKILFLTSTRADFGKLKPLMKAVEASPDMECIVFATGMHPLKLYGSTIFEVQRAGFSNIHVFMNQIVNEPMAMALSNTIAGLSRYVHEVQPDMIVVHGDRVEALAGATVGTLHNILVAHIEGGEVSGTVDETIRHAVSKLSHLHLVANLEAANRLRQMGERAERIFVIGSPDLDVMDAATLPPLAEAKGHYDIPFDRFAIALFHSVTTELKGLRNHARQFVDALVASDHNYVLIYPNNDEGAGIILNEYHRLENHPRFRIFPSLRFEYFLTLLKHMQFMVGNSSAGIREAPFYGLPTVNVGSRQNRRCANPSIINTANERDEILAGIAQAALASSAGPLPRSTHFGDGNSLPRFLAFLKNAHVWKTPMQKQFADRPAQPETLAPPANEVALRLPKVAVTLRKVA